MEPIVRWKTNAEPLYLDLWDDLLKVVVIFLTVALGHVLLRGGQTERWFETLGLEMILFILLGVCVHHLWIRVTLRVES